MSDIHEQIDGLVKNNRVVLFMKGTRSFPQCGFSQRAVGILKSLGAPIKDVNVLADPALRQGVKDYSNWPTIPQVYIDGKFVGGSDILAEMFDNGELHALLGVERKTPKAPAVTFSEAAEAAFRSALADAGDDVLRFECDERLRHELFLGPRQPGDHVIEARSVKLHVSPGSAERVDGAHIDFVDDGRASGFRISNPNESPGVKPVSASQLAAWLSAGKEVHVFDVRTPEERRLAKIEPSTLLDEAGLGALERLPRDATIVFYCHHGIRSSQAAARLASEGYGALHNLTGGIEAWSLDVDPTIPRY